MHRRHGTTTAWTIVLGPSPNSRPFPTPHDAFGTSGEFWLNLQKLYELRLAEQKNGATIARLPTLETGTDLHATG